jgi:seryl-tRNA synthetase
MLDLKFIRENPEVVRQGIKKKNEKDNIDQLLELDEKRREIIKNVESQKALKNQASSEVAKLKKEGKDASEIISKMKSVSDEITKLDHDLSQVDLHLKEILLTVPNLPHESVPIGSDPSFNVEIRRWVPEGHNYEIENNNYLDHLALGKKLRILDFERAAKISGSGFPLYIGKGATLERALLNFMIDIHIEKHGYQEVFPPFLVNRASMISTGQIPKMEEDMYRCDADDLFPIPTAEVPITNIYRDEMLKEEELPIKYVGYSACFRREAGSYGKDTKGFLRVHQFNKIEMVKFVKPEDSYNELELLVIDAENVLKELKIPYRIVMLCTGDLSFAAAMCYDIEVWAPIEQKYLEASSCSNFVDFQARRANIRFKRKAGGKPEFVHTLNGSGLATSRLMVAIMENYQTPEGKLIVPKVLQKYTGFEIIG